MSSLHLVNSNSLLRSRLKYHLFRKSLLGPPVQLWTVTNSVVTNSQFSSLRCAYTFICVALCSQLTLLFQVHDGMGVVCLGSQIYPQHLIVSGSEQMHNKCLIQLFVTLWTAAQEKKICHCFYFPPSICHEVMEPNAMILVF